MLTLLPLLDEVAAAVDDFGLDKAPLVVLARALYNLYQGVHQLHAKWTRVTVHELLLVDGKHLSHV